MEIVETRIFTKRILEILDDENYRLLQLALIADPARGVVIPGNGGLRKLRWRVQGKGKRGGVRIIYYWAVGKKTIVMLFAFKKNEISDLSPAQVSALRKIIESEYP